LSAATRRHDENFSFGCDWPDRPEAAVEKWEADIRDAGATLLAVDGCDLVYDCIGLPGDQMHLHPVTARNIAGAGIAARGCPCCAQ
jgi:hypothetical protein